MMVFLSQMKMAMFLENHQLLLNGELPRLYLVELEWPLQEWVSFEIYFYNSAIKTYCILSHTSNCDEPFGSEGILKTVSLVSCTNSDWIM